MTGFHKGPRWSLDALVDYAEANGLSQNAIALATGLAGANWFRAREYGLTDRQADKAATRLGLHPNQLWPDWTDVALTVLDHLYLESGWRQAWLWNERVA